jgi:hypothetical protein
MSREVSEQFGEPLKQQGSVPVIRAELQHRESGTLCRCADSFGSTASEGGELLKAGEVAAQRQQEIR